MYYLLLFYILLSPQEITQDSLTQNQSGKLEVRKSAQHYKTNPKKKITKIVQKSNNIPTITNPRTKPGCQTVPYKFFPSENEILM